MDLSTPSGRLSLGLIALAMGCVEPAPPLSDAVLWIESAVPTLTDALCNAEIEHTFMEAVPTGQGGSAQLVELDQSTGSPSGEFAYLTRQGREGLLLGLDGVVYTGTFIDERTIEVAWTASEEGTSAIDFFEEYAFAGAETALVEETLKLIASDDEATQFEGTLEIREVRDVTYRESDEWNSSATSILFSSLPGDEWLETTSGFGDVRNRPTTDDCLETECELVVSSSCVRTVALTAALVEGGREAFEALAPFGRDVGVPDASPPPPTP